MSSDQTVTATFNPVVPVLSALWVTPRRFRLCVKRHSKGKRCTRPIKLTVSFQLNVAASVKITIARSQPGRLVKRTEPAQARSWQLPAHRHPDS